MRGLCPYFAYLQARTDRRALLEIPKPPCTSERPHRAFGAPRSDVSTWAAPLWAQPKPESTAPQRGVLGKARGRAVRGEAPRHPRSPPGLLLLGSAPRHQRAAGCGTRFASAVPSTPPAPKAFGDRGKMQSALTKPADPTSPFPRGALCSPGTQLLPVALPCPPRSACPQRISADNSPAAPSHASPARKMSFVRSQLLNSRSRRCEGPFLRSSVKSFCRGSRRLRPREGLNRGPTAPRSPVAPGLVARHAARQRSLQLLRGHRATSLTLQAGH